MKRKIIPFSSQVVIITLFVILFSVLFSLANLVYDNYQYDLKRKEFEAENRRYEEENRAKMYEFLRSKLRRVLEKERKETMNEINPGEQVIVLHNDERERIFQQPESERVYDDTERETDRYANLSNLQKWRYFFFE